MPRGISYLNGRVVNPVRHTSFPPLVAPSSRLLILGSLPGAQSLAAQQYYAHPQNQFWKLLESVFDISLISASYADRLAALTARHIALWDVIESASRLGSSDGAIKNAAPQNLWSVLDQCPQLTAIGFNGAKAAQIGRRILAEKSDMLTLTSPSTAEEPRQLHLLDLPSSSAANTQKFESKRQAWAALAPFIRTA